MAKAKTLTETARAILEGENLNESGIPSIGPLGGGVSNPNPVDPSTASTGNAKTLRPNAKAKEERHAQNGAGAPGPEAFPAAQDLGGSTPTSNISDNLGAKGAVKGKDKSKSSKANVAAEPPKKLSEEDEVISEEAAEISEFIELALAEGIDPEDILSAIAEEYGLDEETMETIAEHLADVLSEEHCEDDDDDDDKDDKKKKEKMDETYEVDMTEHVNALLEGENLSEEFREKATTIFEAAVKAKIEEELALIEKAYAETLEERVEQIKEELTSDVDDYLNYMIETWLEENAVAVESSLRSELTEDFISGLRALFAEHYIDIPEEEVVVVEELAQTVEELEAKLNEEIERNVNLSAMLGESRKNEIIGEVCEGLTATQVEKVRALMENVTYTGDEEYLNKIETIKENYFPSAVKTEKVLDTKMITESDEGDNAFLDDRMGRYVNAIGRRLPN